MVKKGYVYLEMVPGSKNRKIICLTAEQKAFERIPLEEKAAIISGLDKFICYFKEEIDNKEQ